MRTLLKLFLENSQITLKGERGRFNFTATGGFAVFVLGMIVIIALTFGINLFDFH